MKGNTRWGQEVLAGLVMFFGVFPILRAQGNPEIILASSLWTILVSTLSNLPLVVLPYFPLVALFSFLREELQLPPEVALGTLLLGGGLAFLFSLWTGWYRFFRVFPLDLSSAFSGGLGLLLLLRGLAEARILVLGSSGWLELGDFSHPRVLAALLGLLVAAVLFGVRLKGALLFGMLATALFAFWKGLWSFGGGEHGLSLPLFQVDILGVFRYGTSLTLFVAACFVFFETLGLLGGLLVRLDENFSRFPWGLRLGTLSPVFGALFGVPGLLAGAESAIAVGERGRRGLAGVVCGGCLLASFLFFRFFPPLPAFIAAPALCIGGFAMMEPLSRIDFKNASWGIPAFLALGVTAGTLSLAQGVAFGVVSHTVLGLVLGRRKSLHPVFYFLSLLAVLFLVFQ